MNARPAFKAFIFLLLMLLLSVGLTGCLDDDDGNDGPPPPPAASSDADLSALSVSAGTLDPAFSPDVTDYAVTVGNAVTEVSVTATASDDAATLTVDGAATDSGAASAPVALMVGTTSIDIVVTAEDGTTKTYAITVTREPSDDATLSALELSAAALNETFDPAATAYTAVVANDVDSTTVTATANDDAATLEIDGTAIDSGSASDPIALEVGENTITVSVTAGDGTTTETYTVTVTRADPAIVSADVSILVLSADARLIEGATLTVESSGETATTGPDGRATVPVPEESRQLIRATAPGYLPQTLPLNLPAEARPGVFKVALIAEADPIQIAAAENGGSAAGADGASVTLPAGALVDPAGQPVTGPVDVYITPLDVADDRAFAAFPGGFEAENAAGDPGFMLSYGTVDFRFEQNGEVLSLADGQTATIEIPIYVSEDSQGAPLSAGAAISLWSLDEDTSLWLEEGQGTVVASASSPTGLALRGEVSHFSWWNCDDFRDTGEIDVTIDCSGLGASCTAEVPVPASNLVCEGGADGGPRYSGMYGLSGGATLPRLPVPSGTDLDCSVDADGGIAATTDPDPVNATAGSVLPVDVILGPAHLNDDRFLPGERLRGDMTAVGEVHTYRFDGIAGEIFRVTAYPAMDGTSEPGLTGNLGATVSVYSGTTELASAPFESTIAGEIEVTLPADGEFEVRFRADGKVPGWYLATTELRSPALSGANGKVAFLARDRGSAGRPGARLHTVPEGASPYLELSDEFVDDFSTDGVRFSPARFTGARELPYYREVVPGRIIYLADHDTPGTYELYMVDLASPGAATKLNGAETASGEVSYFRVSPNDPTRVVYRVGSEDFGRQIWFVDTDDPGNSVRIAEPLSDPLYSGNQAHFEFVAGGDAVVYQADYTTDNNLEDGDLYLVDLDDPTVATRLNAPLDHDGGERIQQFDSRSAVSPDGSLVAYVANLTDESGVLHLVDVSDPGNAIPIQLDEINEERTIGVQFSPDGTKLVAVRDRFSGAGNGPLYLVDVTDPAQPAAAQPLDDFIDPDYIWIDPASTLVLAWRSDSIRRYNFAPPGDFVFEWNFPAPASVYRLRFTADGTAFVAQLHDDATSLGQLWLHALGEDRATQTRIGPRDEALVDSDYGVIYFDLAADGETVYYMADIVFREGEIFQTTLTDPDGDRQVVVERIDDQVIIDTPADGRNPTFLILEAGQNPAP
ncbi:cadherin-like beta sandwich domain-containing protein [Lentisalinibacter sediminis]|uniref:cadherin-like beta sandwich domain-containing protein n=1 Tax=Lentisalinibacter sediminis TaxID=2992237 RepID=UPI00386CFA6B